MISSFKGEYAWLSNMEPCPILHKGKIYSCVETPYQMEKCANEEDKARFARYDGYEAKREGKKIQVRADWDDVKVKIMGSLLKKKFINIPSFRARLEATGDQEIVEGNYWHDNFWGNCTCPRCSHVEGRNALGKMLMQIRNMNRKEKINDE